MKRKLCIGIMVFCLLELLALLSWRLSAAPDILQIEYDDRRLYFYYDCMNRTYDDEESVRINSYQDEETGEFYLFFPKSLQKNKSKLLLYGADEIVVNQEFYETDDKVKFLEPGRYSIAIKQNFYVLNVMYGSDIPAVFIDLDTGNLDFVHENKENIDTGSLNMYDKKGKLIYRDTLLGMHGRGNYSWLYHLKKGYAVSLKNKGVLLDGVYASKWNFIGSSYDPYLIKNKIVYDLAEDVSLDNAIQANHIELYIAGDYMGTYLLTNKVRIDQSGVNIWDLEKETSSLNTDFLDQYPQFETNEDGEVKNKGYVIPNNPQDITGSYLIEQDIYDRYVEERCGFRTKSRGDYVIQSPEYASKEQVLYIQDYIQEIEDAVGEGDGINPKTQKHYTEYIDMDSFLKSYLLQETVKNYDMNVTSQYFYKPKGENSVLFSGPAWDFDNSMGTSSATMGGNAEKLTTMDNPRDLLGEFYLSKEKAVTFANLYLHDDFRKQAIEMYYDQFQPKLKLLLRSGLEDYTDRLGNSNQMNQVRWSLDKDWDSEIAGISDFLTKRMVFLEEIWQED